MLVMADAVGEGEAVVCTVLGDARPVGRSVKALEAEDAWGFFERGGTEMGEKGS